ncbi:hypothetical protein F9L16_24010 [Agarivorans sp. B2Z047]|uniref:hypothetical protein n=1 Tax=Agarivorans sp. B2Z047 TaxID=2652721 RepID=UPI00128C3485|nr:hypothetical protein [Agarivorans sp. B2Z047]MPW32013.1 hypothetical protein [Agarivorans sp. B2Z047]UQN41915.1 hypothetical protein LQZ07_19365 [Agarivorans sp. B2Z047]UQN44852.1 hypothetical protein LQZ07_10425 [Agarivorans sp. B2Z047]
MLQGEYYLHENGSLIYKPHGGVDVTSTFVKRCWAVSELGQTPRTFMFWLIDAFEAGATRAEIERVAAANNLDNYTPNWRDEVFKVEPQ